jgi:hypothetical protein
VVPVADDAETLALEVAGAAGVGFFAVLAAVQFDDQLLLQADEVHDEGPDAVLEAEFAAAKAAVAKVGPEPKLGFGGLAAQARGSGAYLSFNREHGRCI